MDTAAACAIMNYTSNLLFLLLGQVKGVYLNRFSMPVYAIHIKECCMFISHNRDSKFIMEL